MTPASVLTGGLYFFDLGLDARPVGDQHEDLRHQVDLGRRQHGVEKPALHRILGVGPLTRHEAGALEGLGQARRDDRPLGLLVHEPARGLVRRLHHVAIGDDPAVAVDEPARARLAEYRRRHLRRPRAAVERHLGGHFGHHEDDGRLGAKEAFLHGDVGLSVNEGGSV